MVWQDEIETPNGTLCACRTVDEQAAEKGLAATVGLGSPSSTSKDVRGATSFPDDGDAGRRATGGNVHLFVISRQSLG